MRFISVTRLRIRSLRFMPLFAVHTSLSLRQVRRAPGFLDGSLLPDHDRAFWTLTAWDEAASMRAYLTSGPHRTAMLHLMHWCDEAPVVHWDQPGDDLPDWSEADRRMRRDGRASKVRHPSPNHAALTYREPRLGFAAPIRSVA